MSSPSAQPAAQALTLSNGYKMPQLGIGTARTPDGEDTCNAILWALQAGYRHVDTAAMYKNEVGVGQGVRKAMSELGLRREEIFVTTKVWNDRHGYDETLEAFEESMEKLDIGYVDLYLIHWPRGDSFIAQDGKKYLESWRALEKIYADGRAKAIGVANFESKHLQDVLAQCTVKPMVNQVELHPLNQQVELRKFCDEHNIKITCWSPIGQGKLLDDTIIATIAAAHKRTPAQVILRWELQLGLITIPKSTHKERIIENAKIFDFALTEEEVQTINSMNKDQRYGPIPSEATF